MVLHHYMQPRHDLLTRKRPSQGVKAWSANRAALINSLLSSQEVILIKDFLWSAYTANKHLTSATRSYITRAFNSQIAMELHHKIFLGQRHTKARALKMQIASKIQISSLVSLAKDKLHICSFRISNFRIFCLQNWLYHCTSCSSIKMFMSTFLANKRYHPQQQKWQINSKCHLILQPNSCTKIHPRTESTSEVVMSNTWKHSMCKVSSTSSWSRLVCNFSWKTYMLG